MPGVGGRESGVEEGTSLSPTPDSRPPTPAVSLALAAVVLAVATIAFIQSYCRWLDPIIDTGRDLYIPEQLARGAKLYRDIRYQYPPLAPYLLALITGGIGHSLAAYMAIGVAQSMTIAASLWIALRRPVPAFAATLSFAAICFCGASTWGANFLFPYSYGATIGMALLCIALAAFVHARNAIAIAALVLASGCKVEYAVAAFVIVCVLAAARRLTMRQVTAYASSMVFSFAAVAFYFRDSNWWSENVFAAWQHGARAKRFFEIVSGVASWREQLVQIAVGVAGIAAIYFLQRWRNWLAAVAVIIVAVLIADHSFFRAWAVLQWVALGWALVRDRESPLLIFAAFSVATTLRIPLNVSPSWYGFVLTVPAFALAAYALFCYLPRRNMMAVLWIAPFLTNAGNDLWQQHIRYAEKRYAIVSQRGTFYDWNADRAAILNRMIATVHDGTLAVMPEGITINYLTQTRTPLTFHTFTPVETADPDVEGTIMRELIAHPPDRVLLVSRDVREYGSRGFGVDYDIHVTALLRDGYRVQQEWRGERFEAILLRNAFDGLGLK
ncbi:MAG TPA: hypothetical protein VNN08_14740 [Thermoanaerobaculia bacterium]|nr:hypothetical protein [Thermoanaerobaculia bacterium]